MITLYGFRHSLNDANSDISPEGLELARRQGAAMSEVVFSVAFVGVLPRTEQTRDAFFDTYEIGPAYHDERIEGLGSDELFNEMKPIVRWNDFPNHYDAVVACASPEQLTQWRLLARVALREMFSISCKEETNVFFGHSPVIQLMASTCFENIELPQEFRHLPEMAGIVFQLDENYNITVVRYIPAPAPEEAPAAAAAPTSEK